MIVALPQQTGPGNSVGFEVVEPGNGGNRFVCSYDLTEGWCLVVGDMEMQDAVNMVWHDDKLVERHARKAFRKACPGLLKDDMKLAHLKDWLMMGCTDSHEITGCPTVIVMRQAH